MRLDETNLVHDELAAELAFAAEESWSTPDPVRRDHFRTLARVAVDFVDGETGFTIEEVDAAIRGQLGDGPLVEYLLDRLAAELGAERVLR